MEMRLLDLNKVVEGFGKMLRRTLREDITIKTEYVGSPCMIRGDAGQIEQILLNLAINAQDAMPGGGALGIKTSPVFLDEAFAHVRPGAVPGEYVSLAVSDNGMGMSEEVRTKIFEPFYTTKEIGRGTGLGLSMVYGIVKQHGGYIDV
jgi:signal transduction histidine kinase